MDKRLKYLLNKELRKIGEQPYDCGDEWTELIERVFQKLISEREKKLRAEIERLTRENEALRNDVASADKLLQGDSHDGCAVIEMQLKALLRRHVETIEKFGPRGTAEVHLLIDSRAVLAEERGKQ